MKQMTILAFSCILHSLCEREAFKQAQNTASVFLLPKIKKNTFNNIEIKQLCFASHYTPWALATQNDYKQASEVITNAPLTPTGRAPSWMCMPRVHLPDAECPREALFNKCFQPSWRQQTLCKKHKKRNFLLANLEGLVHSWPPKTRTSKIKALGS